MLNTYVSVWLLDRLFGVTFMFWYLSRTILYLYVESRILCNVYNHLYLSPWPKLKVNISLRTELATELPSYRARNISILRSGHGKKKRDRRSFRKAGELLSSDDRHRDTNFPMKWIFTFKENTLEQFNIRQVRIRTSDGCKSFQCIYVSTLEFSFEYSLMLVAC